MVSPYFGCGANGNPLFRYLRIHYQYLWSEWSKPPDVSLNLSRGDLKTGADSIYNPDRRKHLSSACPINYPQLGSQGMGVREV